MLGIGVMLSYLGGNEESVKAFKEAIGKEIRLAALEDNEFLLRFTDGSGVAFFDDGQSCCEHRYMVCDDDLSQYAGSTLVSAELADAPDVEAGYDAHEVQFLRVQTSNGVIVCSNHNEHNGYYGGFSIRVRRLHHSAE